MPTDDEPPSRPTARPTNTSDTPPDLARRRALKGLGTLPWFGAAAAQGAPAFVATIQLAPDRPGRPANPRLLGSNTPWVYGSERLMDDAGRWIPAMIARAREWSPPPSPSGSA